MLSLFGLLLTASCVWAHASLNPPVAVPGSYFQTSIRISHGCKGAATNNVTVVIPEGVLSVRPRAVPGWTITINDKPLNPPIQDSHGKTINTTVGSISWTGGNLPDAWYEDFGISMKLPKLEDGTKLYWPVYQMCVDGGSNPWAQLPNGSALEFPAASLTLNTNGTLIPATSMSSPQGTAGNAKNAANTLQTVSISSLGALAFSLLFI